MNLVDASLAARLNAHAPYSNFLVGAALEDIDGRVHVARALVEREHLRRREQRGLKTLRHNCIHPRIRSFDRKLDIDA